MVGQSSWLVKCKSLQDMGTEVEMCEGEVAIAEANNVAGFKAITILEDDALSRFCHSVTSTSVSHIPLSPLITHLIPSAGQALF